MSTHLDFEKAIQLCGPRGKSGSPLRAPSAVPKVLGLELVAFDAGGQGHVPARARAVYGTHAVFVMLL